MLIVIIGAPKSGKDTLAHHLESAHHFTRVRVVDASSTTLSGARSTRQSDLVFPSSSAFLDHATAQYQANYVTTDVRGFTRLQEFAKRPFVAVVAVQAPLMKRYQRAVSWAREHSQDEPSLGDFVEEDDLAMYGDLSGPPAAELSSLRLDNVPSTPKKEALSPHTNAPPSPSPSPARSPEFELAPALSGHGRGRQRRRSRALSDCDPLVSLLPLAHCTLSNVHDTPARFATTLSLARLADALRPSWDTYFLKLSVLASLRSNCMKRRVGAVLVRERRVVSTGYNGTPRGVTNCNQGGCARCNNSSNSVGVALDECLCLHAEENALLEAGRERVSGGGIPGATLYCNTCPCLRCTVKIVQCGVTEVVYSLSYAMDAESRRIMEQAGILLRQVELPPL